MYKQSMTPTIIMRCSRIWVHLTHMTFDVEAGKLINEKKNYKNKLVIYKLNLFYLMMERSFVYAYYFNFNFKQQNWLFNMNVIQWRNVLVLKFLFSTNAFQHSQCYRRIKKNGFDDTICVTMNQLNKMPYCTNTLQQINLFFWSSNWYLHFLSVFGHAIVNAVEQILLMWFIVTWFIII